MKAKAYKVELFVLDTEGIPQEEIISMLERTRYLYPSVVSIEGRELGEWKDDHPLNKPDTFQQTYNSLFKS